MANVLMSLNNPYSPDDHSTKYFPNINRTFTTLYKSVTKLKHHCKLSLLGNLHFDGLVQERRTSLLTHWNYVFLALTYRFDIRTYQWWYWTFPATHPLLLMYRWSERWWGSSVTNLVDSVIWCLADNWVIRSTCGQWWMVGCGKIVGHDKGCTLDVD